MSGGLTNEQKLEIIGKLQNKTTNEYKGTIDLLNEIANPPSAGGGPAGTDPDTRVNAEIEKNGFYKLYQTNTTGATVENFKELVRSKKSNIGEFLETQVNSYKNDESTINEETDDQTQISNLTSANANAGSIASNGLELSTNPSDGATGSVTNKPSTQPIPGSNFYLIKSPKSGVTYKIQVGEPTPADKADQIPGTAAPTPSSGTNLAPSMTVPVVESKPLALPEPANENLVYTALSKVQDNYDSRKEVVNAINKRIKDINKLLETPPPGQENKINEIKRIIDKSDTVSAESTTAAGLDNASSSYRAYLTELSLTDWARDTDAAEANAEPQQPTIDVFKSQLKARNEILKKIEELFKEAVASASGSDSGDRSNVDAKIEAAINAMKRSSYSDETISKTIGLINNRIKSINNILDEAYSASTRNTRVKIVRYIIEEDAKAAAAAAAAAEPAAADASVELKYIWGERPYTYTLQYSLTPIPTNIGVLKNDYVGDALSSHFTKINKNLKIVVEFLQAYRTLSLAEKTKYKTLNDKTIEDVWGEGVWTEIKNISGGTDTSVKVTGYSLGGRPKFTRKRSKYGNRKSRRYAKY